MQLRMTNGSVTILQQLNEYHATIEQGIAEVEAHCERAEPDLVSLATLRVQLSHASMMRSQLVREVIVPRLREGADPNLAYELGQILQVTSTNRVASAVHVTNWSSWLIKHDLNGYREASRSIRKMMQEQVDRERATLCNRLQALGL